MGSFQWGNQLIPYLRGTDGASEKGESSSHAYLALAVGPLGEMSPPRSHSCRPLGAPDGLGLELTRSMVCRG